LPEAHSYLNGIEVKTAKELSFQKAAAAAVKENCDSVMTKRKFEHFINTLKIR
jgi:membrane carboxypeptidase/penicillin-binding protein